MDRHPRAPGVSGDGAVVRVGRRAAVGAGASGCSALAAHQQHLTCRLQVWLPKLPREASPRFTAGTTLSVDSAPFVMNDPSAAPLRRKSMESSFGRGHGLPGRVWATGSAEVIQDSTFVSAQHYSLRPSALSGGVLTESLAVPIFVGAPVPELRGKDKDPIGVLEVVMASSQHAVTQDAVGTSLEGRLRLVQGGAAAVIASICAALDSAGLSCSPPSSGEDACVAPKAAVPAAQECTGASWGVGDAATTGNTAASAAANDDDRSRSSVDGGRRTPRHSASLSRISSCRVLNVPPSVA